MRINYCSIVDCLEIGQAPIESLTDIADPPHSQIVICPSRALQELVSHLERVVNVSIEPTALSPFIDTLIYYIGEKSVRDPGGMMIRETKECIVHSY